MTLTRQQVAALVAELEQRVKLHPLNGNLVNRAELIEYAASHYSISEKAAYNHMRKAERRQRWLRRKEWETI